MTETPEVNTTPFAGNTVFHFYAYGPFSGRTVEFEAIETHLLSSLQAAFAQFRPGCELAIEVPKVNDWKASLTFTTLTDFTAAGVIEQVPALQLLAQLKQGVAAASKEEPMQLADYQKHAAFASLQKLAAANAGDSGNATIDLLSMVDIEEEDNGASLGAVNDLLSQVTYTGADAKKLSKQLDQVLQDSLDQIFKNATFLSLAGLWFGLAELFATDSVQVKVSVTDCAIEDYCDLTFEAFVGPNKGKLPEPSVLLYATPFESSADHVEVLHHLGRMADYLACPVLFPMAANFFKLKTWRMLTHYKDISGRMSGPEYIKWRKLRNEVGGRWLFPLAGALVRDDEGREGHIDACFWVAGHIARTLASGQWPDDALHQPAQAPAYRVAATLSLAQVRELSFEGFSTVHSITAGEVQLPVFNCLAGMTLEPGEQLSESVMVEYTFAYQLFVGALSKQLFSGAVSSKEEVAQFAGLASAEDVRIEDGEEGQRIYLVKTPFPVFGLQAEVIIAVG